MIKRCTSCDNQTWKRFHPSFWFPTSDVQSFRLHSQKHRSASRFCSDGRVRNDAGELAGRTWWFGRTRRGIFPVFASLCEFVALKVSSGRKSCHITINDRQLVWGIPPSIPKICLSGILLRRLVFLLVIKWHAVPRLKEGAVLIFTALQAPGLMLCLPTERNSLNLLASMLIPVKLSGRWPGSRQPDSETDYKWAKRQQPLDCCGGQPMTAEEGKRWRNAPSAAPHIALHPSINPSPSWPPPWLIDAAKARTFTAENRRSAHV